MSMKRTVVLSPQPSRDRSTAGGDSSYFPRCRKDTNCHCEMCIASINATLDLVSSSRGAATPPTPPKTPNPPRAPAFEASPALRSTAKSCLVEDMEKESAERELKGGGWGVCVRWVAVICLVVVVVWGVDVGVPLVVRVVGGGVRLDGGVARRVGEGVVGDGDLKWKVMALEMVLRRELGVDDGEVGNCSSDGSNWVLHKEGHLLYMKCVLYKSMVEELSIWGFPTRTSGLLVTGLSSRSFTLLSGHIHEWHEDKLDFDSRRPGSSWMTRQLSKAIVQLAENSWVLEYHQNALLQEGRLMPIIKKILSLRLLQIREEMTQRNWFFLSISNYVRLVGRSVEDLRPPT